MSRYNRDRDYDRERRQQENRTAQRDNYGQHRGQYGRDRDEYSQDRSFWNRTEDEVRSWFGDEDAERRRMNDDRYRNQRDLRPEYGRYGRNRQDNRNYPYNEAAGRYGREYENRYGNEMRQSGMDNEDWRHMDDYWRDMYGDRYPRSPRETSQDSPRHMDDSFAGLGGPNDWMSTRNPNSRNFAGRGPRNYKRSDERIQEDINEHLTRHPMIDATEVQVTVKDGEVTLRGSVEERAAKRMAEDIADSVSGVHNVRNEIRVQPQTGQQQQQRKEPGSDRAA